MKKILIVLFIAVALLLTIAADGAKYFCALQSWQAYEGANNWAFQGTYLCKYLAPPPADLPQFTITQAVRLPKFFECEGVEFCGF